jgi:hypothetical protein
MANLENEKEALENYISKRTNCLYCGQNKALKPHIEKDENSRYCCSRHRSSLARYGLVGHITDLWPLACSWPDYLALSGTGPDTLSLGQLFIWYQSSTYHRCLHRYEVLLEKYKSDDLEYYRNKYNWYTEQQTKKKEQKLFVIQLKI